MASELLRVISFEVLGNRRDNEAVLIVSGETSRGDDEAAELLFDLPMLHRVVGRLLGAMVELDPEHTLAALRSVLATNAEVS